MKRLLRILLIGLTVLVTVGALTGVAGLHWYTLGKRAQRDGTLSLQGLQAPVRVAYDERGVPHLSAQNEADLYRALGYVHAQDRLFQMELIRRLARGELAEIFGPKLLDADRLFRTLRLRAHAQTQAEALDPAAPATQALLAYLDGINQYQATRPAPLEFELLGIPKRPFTPTDTLAVTGYLAYSFAAALKTEPLLSYVRDQLGTPYLDVFNLEWNPLGVLPPPTKANFGTRAPDWNALTRLASLSQEVLERTGIPSLEGSNAWAVSGRRTASGKPLLAGDPHIGYAAPAVWYEAHLRSPGFELYGHYQALNPMALLGHNTEFGWSLTMFQNDDMDLVAEHVNPENPNQVWFHGQWVELENSTETILVKGARPATLQLRRSPHGPLITDALPETRGGPPIAMWWTFQQTDNPLLDAFYSLNRASTRAQAREAVSQIHAPGLNIVWANARGDIGWWAAAKLPIRPEGVNPAFILRGDTGEADKLGFYRFQDNPQEENPARGYVVSANQQPTSRSGLPVPGYYNPPDRALVLDQALRRPDVLWNVTNSIELQLNVQSQTAQQLLQLLVPELRSVVLDPEQRGLMESLAQWDGLFVPERIEPTFYTQFSYELLRLTFADKLGPERFQTLLGTRLLDQALPRLVEDQQSPWWKQKDKPQKTRRDVIKAAWLAAWSHLETTFGKSTVNWSWGQTHTLTHNHPLGQQKPLHLLFNVGPFPAPGGREIVNNYSQTIGPAPWAVSYGPSTRRLIDFADTSQALGINPLGQSGVLLDPHYKDQALDYMSGRYQPMHLNATDVQQHTRSTLQLHPAR